MNTTVKPINEPLDDHTTDEFERVLGLLESSRAFGKGVYQSRLLGLTQRILAREGGVQALYALAPRFCAAGVFAGSDWDQPQNLQSALARHSLLGDAMTAALESLSQLRFLAIATGDAQDERVTPEQARAFLEDTLARNLDLLYPVATEETRMADSAGRGRLENLLGFILENLGGGGVFDALLEECDRVLLQRPIMVQRVEAMLQAVKQAQRREPELLVGSDYGRYLLAALDGPSQLSRDYPDPDAYSAALEALSPADLRSEAQAFGVSMDTTGLVCPLHATLMRFLATASPDLLGAALALNDAGRSSLSQYALLIRLLVENVVFPDTARCIYGLSRMLNRGILFFRPVAPGLQRLMLLPILPAVAGLLHSASGLAEPPSANALLVAGTLSVIGQPRGVDQGHNPTCQTARAISLWSQNDVGYLLEIIAQAARDGDVAMHFEDEMIHSSMLISGLADQLHTELDPVSLVLTPHLDKIYIEMGRRCAHRPGDAHQWINPEFHGWWVHRGFALLVDPGSGALLDFDAFARLFHAAYHPQFNGGRDLVYAQPCGIVSTNANAEFGGWHAVSIQRVAPGPQGEWRIYFYNPNRDKGQNWGQQIVTSTHDHGELEGESSLPFEQFLSRLYLFHYNPRELGDPELVPAERVAATRELVAEGWADGRDWIDPPADA